MGKNKVEIHILIPHFKGTQAQREELKKKAYKKFELWRKPVVEMNWTKTVEVMGIRSLQGGHETVLDKKDR